MSQYKVSQKKKKKSKKSQTYREQELLDLLHGMSHAQVSIGHRGEDFDEHMQLHRQVGVLWLPSFPQPFFLKYPMS